MPAAAAIAHDRKVMLGDKLVLESTREMVGRVQAFPRRPSVGELYADACLPGATDLRMA